MEISIIENQNLLESLLCGTIKSVQFHVQQIWPIFSTL